MGITIDGHGADDFLAGGQEEVADKLGLVEETAGVETEVEDEGRQGAATFKIEDRRRQVAAGVGVELIHADVAHAFTPPGPHRHHLHEVADNRDDHRLGHALALEGQGNRGALRPLDALHRLVEGQPGGAFAIDGQDGVAVLDPGSFGGQPGHDALNRDDAFILGEVGADAEEFASHILAEIAGRLGRHQHRMGVEGGQGPVEHGIGEVALAIGRQGGAVEFAAHGFDELHGFIDALGNRGLDGPLIVLVADADATILPLSFDGNLGGFDGPQGPFDHQPGLKALVIVIVPLQQGADGGRHVRKRQRLLGRPQDDGEEKGRETAQGNHGAQPRWPNDVRKAGNGQTLPR